MHKEEPGSTGKISKNEDLYLESYSLVSQTFGSKGTTPTTLPEGTGLTRNTRKGDVFHFLLRRRGEFSLFAVALFHRRLCLLRLSWSRFFCFCVHSKRRLGTTHFDYEEVFGGRPQEGSTTGTGQRIPPRPHRKL